MGRLRDYLYLDKGYHAGVSDGLYAQVLAQGGKIINLDEEGAVDYTDQSTLTGRYSRQLFENSSLILFWGERQRELVSESWSNNVTTAVTGHPRFDLLKEQHQYLYEDDVNDIRRRFRDFILINTNMGFGNNIRGDAFVRENYGPRFKQIDRIIEFDKRKLQSYIELVRTMAAETSKDIILRPHPEESRAVYEEAFDDLANVNVIFEGSVVPWLIAAEIMIHPDCTTALESYFMGRIPFSYLPDSFPEDLVTNLPLKASYQFITREAVLNAVLNPSTIDLHIDETQQSLIEEYFSYSKDSTELVVGEISSLFPPREVGAGLSLGDWFFFQYRQFRKDIKSGSGSRLIKNKLDGFHRNPVNDLISKIGTQNGNAENVRIEALTRELFRFKANPEKSKWGRS